MTANDRQVDGTHYQGKPVQHWDFVLMHNMGYMEAQIFKYVLRWKGKNGLADLRKARHFIDKLIEWELEVLAPVVDVCSGAVPPPPGLEALAPTRNEEFKVGSGTVILEGDQLTRARQVLDDPEGKHDNDYLNPDSGNPRGKGYVDQD